MPLYIVRPGHLHTTDRVLSCTQEQGLTVAAAVADADNTGALRLRTSAEWPPIAATSLDVALHTGGNVVGYSVAGVAGEARGAAIRWKHTTDGGTLWRGFTDSTHLVRVAHPIAYNANHALPSRPRPLPDGYLGVLTLDTSTKQSTFWRIGTDWSATSATIGTGSTAPASADSADFEILPDGRLVAIVRTAAANAEPSCSVYTSDDYGASWTQAGNTGGPTNIVGELWLQRIDDQITWFFQTSGLLSMDDGLSFIDMNADLLASDVTVANGFLLQLAGGGVKYASPGSRELTTLGTPTAAGMSALVRRDDGTIWTFGWEGAAAGTLQMAASVSRDDGATWTDAADGAMVMDLEKTGYAAHGLDNFRSCVWNGSIILLARADSDTGSDQGLHFLVFGEWANVTDGRRNAASISPYVHSYIPCDYPQALGWTKTDTGGAATLTNQPWLRIVGTGVGGNSRFTSSAAWWSTGTGDTTKIRIRLRVNSGGSLANGCSKVEWSMDDGVNRQLAAIRFTTTTARLLDYTAATIGADLTLDLTKWTDFIIAIAHDSPAGSGKVSIWYKQDADAIYTIWQNGATIPEEAGATGDYFLFGGNFAAAVNWDFAYIGRSESDESMASGFSNPLDLTGRPLSPSADMDILRNIRLGGFSGAGVRGDTYTGGTTYTYGKESIWAEFRPSRQVRSAADAQAWSVVLDAGSGDKLKGDLVALFGTNFRTASFEMNATNSWGAPSVTVSLDATVASFTAGGTARGKGYVGPASSPNWRPGQYRSDGDGHRWFADVGGTVYEITDNDEDRLYIEGEDFTGSTATVYIFGDRMAATQTFAQYRFARVSLGSQDTADGEYRLGTVICDKRWTPAQLYDHGFVDAVEPAVSLTETDTGVRTSHRLGPRRSSLSIQWPPLDSIGKAQDLNLRLRDLYAALEGSHRPVVFWRDSSDQRTLGLYRVLEVFSASNVWGEDGTSVAAVTRIDQLVLSEEL